MLVVFSHIGYLFPIFGYRFEIGAIGVDIFFVISGFVMWITVCNSSAVEFILRRVYRIAPLYWIVTILTSVIGIAGISFGAQPTWIEFLKSILFIAYSNPEQGDRVVPIVGVGWTLNLEMMFYAIFASSIAFAGRYRFLFVAVTLVGILISAELTNHRSTILGFYGQSIILEFLAGMAIGIMYINQSLKLVKSLVVVAFLVVIGTYFIFIGEAGNRLFFYGFPAILIVYLAVVMEGVIPYMPRMLLVGDASYSIYLTHKTVVLLYFTLTLNGIISGNVVLAWVLATALSLLIGLMTYRFVEQPLIKLTKRGTFFQRHKLQK